MVYKPFPCFALLASFLLCTVYFLFLYFLLSFTKKKTCVSLRKTYVLLRKNLCFTKRNLFYPEICVLQTLALLALLASF